MTRFIVPGGFLVLGVSFLAVAAGDYFGWIGIDEILGRDSSPYVEVSQTDIEVDDASILETPVTVQLKNRSSQTVRVVGLAPC